MSNFALVWSKMLESSLWVKESKETRLVWITLLMMKNAEGIIQASVVGLADRAKVTPGECREALRVLLSPDADDTSKVLEGRRLLETPGGWQIVNHDLYRFSTEAKREFWRQQKAEQRRKAEMKPKRLKKGGSERERLAVKALGDGNEPLSDSLSEPASTANDSPAPVDNLSASSRVPGASSPISARIEQSSNIGLP